MDVQLWTLCAATFKNLIWTLDEVNRFSRTMQGVAPSAPSASPPTTETRTGETPRPRGLWWTTAQYHPETSDHLANLVTVWTPGTSAGEEDGGVAAWEGSLG